MTDPTQTEPIVPTEPHAPVAPPPEPSASPGWSAPPPPPAPAPGWTTTAAPHDRGWARGGDVLFGLIFLVVGLWLFADVSLGLDLPRVRWGDLWPVILIVLGGWVLLGAMRRR